MRRPLMSTRVLAAPMPRMLMLVRWVSTLAMEPSEVVPVPCCWPPKPTPS